jgi:hypothetical protein
MGTMATTGNMSMIAIEGVRKTGWVLPAILGATPSRPIQKNIRARALTEAIAHANQDAAIPRSRIAADTGDDCENRSDNGVRLAAMLSGASLSAASWAATARRQSTPMRMGVHVMARGTLTKGLCASPPSVVGLSKPTKALTATTIPIGSASKFPFQANTLPRLSFDGLKAK